MSFAFVFPGQGSQSLGMMKAYEGLSGVRETFAEAGDALGEDLWKLVEEGPAEALNQTVNTQPVMLAAGVAVFRAWRAAGGALPALVAGHSLGEYSALVAAGALTLSQAAPLVRFRAQAMQEAVPEGVGGMAAILGLDEDKLAEACREAAQGQVVEPVNLNSPGQIVIAGHREAVARASELAKAKGAKRALPLPVSVPSHCALMKPAAEHLRTHLESVPILRPQIPVLHNADVADYADPTRIKDALVRQLYSPVRWIESVRELARRGATQVAECGPGKVLAGMTKRIEASLESAALSDAASLTAAITTLR